MNVHWEHKQEADLEICPNPKINEWYELAIRNGAIRRKLIGPPAEGFLMFYAEDQD